MNGYLEKQNAAGKRFAEKRGDDLYMQVFVDSRRACMICDKRLRSAHQDRSADYECDCSFWRYDYRESKLVRYDKPRSGRVDA